MNWRLAGRPTFSLRTCLLSIGIDNVGGGSVLSDVHPLQPGLLTVAGIIQLAWMAKKQA